MLVLLALVTAAVVWLAVWIRFDDTPKGCYAVVPAVVPFAWVGLLALNRTYEHRFIGSGSEEFGRVLRSGLLDVYHEDYIQQARLRGLSEGHILLGHAFKNASLPTLTLAGVQFGILFSGTLLIEVIYSYPGMGNLMVDAVRNADLPIIQLVGLTYCVVVLVINSLVDGLYLVLNPKLRAR